MADKPTKPETIKRDGMELFSREATFAPETYDEEKRTVDILWTTEAPVKRYSWVRGPYNEVLEISKKAVRLDRLNSGNAPFLAAHDSRKLESVIGHVTADSTELKDGKAYATVRLSSADRNADTVADIKDGIIRNISVGYVIHKQDVTENEDGPDDVRVTDWEPYELSAVPIGADAAASFRSSDSLETMEENMGKESKTDEKVETPADERKPEVDVKAETDKARKEGEALARKRIDGIELTARKLEIDRDSDEYLDLRNSNKTLDEVRGALIDLHADRADAETETHNQVSVEVDEFDTRAKGMTGALMKRSFPDMEIDERSNPFVYMSIVDMAREHLAKKGVGGTRTMPPTKVIDLAMRAGPHSTSDFPFVFADVGEKAMMKAYTEYMRTFPLWCRRRDLRNLQTKNEIAVGEFPNTEDVAELGEYQYVTLGERREQWALSKSGNRFAYSDEMAIDDDIDAFVGLAIKAGSACARKQSVTVYSGVLNANPAMGDGTVLFHADHSNIGGSAGVPTAVRIAQLDTLIATQTGVDDVATVGVPMRFLIIPWALKFGVDQLMETAGYQPTSSATVATKAQQQLQVVADPILNGLSAVKWYGAASPNEIDTVDYGFLAGTDGPETKSYREESIDAVVVQWRQFFAAKAKDWRGLAYNAGA